MLAAQDYHVVINLLPDDSEYAVPDERSIIESQGIEYIQIPVKFEQPEPTDFIIFSEALDRVLEKKVHVHCAANYRVSVFYSLYAVSRGLWSTDQAMEYIHSLWRPEDRPGWSEFIAEIYRQGTEA